MQHLIQNSSLIEQSNKLINFDYDFINKIMPKNIGITSLLSNSVEIYLTNKFKTIDDLFRDLTNGIRD